MSRLNNTTKLVRAILAEDEKARNSDSFLYMRVIDAEAAKLGISIDTMTVKDFLLKHKALGFSKSVTVRRARQKAQETAPELRACKAVEKARAVKEKEYRAYALGDAQ